MNKRKKNMIFNWVMLLSLVVVFLSGVLVKVMPGMWLGITHALSGVILVICVMIHCVRHGKFRK